LQGDVREHLRALERAGICGRRVKRPAEIEAVAGLIIPGGESTTIGKLIERFGLEAPIRALSKRGGAIYGTCAGAILLAKTIVGSDQFRLGLMDITIERNAYGRQVDSFEADLEARGVPGGPLRGVFIRAPVIREVGEDVEVLAEHQGDVVLARQGRLLVSTFHPELTDDVRVHRVFGEMCGGV
jgi:5'-phosphate synthase pdxT subunit